MKSKHSYSKGLNKDASKSKYDTSQYYDAYNFRILTNEGLSSGSIVNEEGHTLSFIIPDLPSMTHANGDVIPAQNNLKIIGWGNINDTIVVFTTNESSDTPNSYGQIWKLNWSEDLNVVNNISAAVELTVANHLVYNNALNFSTYYRIGRVVGIYETLNKQRVYWTDNYNRVRTINIADPDTINLDPENLDLAPSIDFAIPVIESVGVGNIPTGSMVQYCYRLLDSNGAQTLFSPITPLYPLTDSDIYTDSVSDFEGNLPGYASGRSVTYSITGLDEDYKVIENYVVIYESNNSPKIYKFHEQDISNSDTITVTHTGNEDYEEISLVEFNILSSGFDICKDLESKDGRLIAVNTKTTKFDVDFDARAYRFNVAGQALLKDSTLGDITLTTPSPNYASVPEEHDAINLYNDENSTLWKLGRQYKYQEDGVTYGGSGTNVSYKFKLKQVQAESGGDTEANHIQISRWSSGSSDDTDLGLTNPNGSIIGISRENQLNSPHSAYIPSYFNGFSRGEVYRFGVVFYNSKGSTSFVKWIGDIRFPEPWEGFKVQDTSSGIPQLYNLGIEFTIDTSSLAADITGFSYVYVERKDNDKTRLGSGALMMFSKQDSNPNTIIDSFNGFGLPFAFTDDTNVNGSTETGNYHLYDRPGFSPINVGFPSTKRIAHLVAPLGLMDNAQNYSHSNGDFIKTLGYFRAYPYMYFDDTALHKYGVHYKMRGYYDMDHNDEYFEIDTAKVLRQGEFISSSDALLDEINDVNNLLNTSYSRDAGSMRRIPLAIGHRKLVLSLKGTPSINNGVSADNMTWINVDGKAGAYYTDSFTGDVGEECWFKQVAYCRYVTNQYGGNTYEARSLNQYKSTGHFQPITASTGTSFTQNVFGGDTYLTYYDEETMRFNSRIDLVSGEPYDDPAILDHKLSVAVLFPCESDVNPAWRTGLHWSNERTAADSSSFDNDITYYYNPVYNQSNNVSQKFYAKDFLADFVEEQPNRIWASENKINGELVDSWRQFKSASYLEVDGIYGPINRILNFKDTLYFFQDGAFGAASINDRSVITDESGQQLVLGNGGVLDNHQYISIVTGSVHQFGVISSDRAIYWYDARLKKFNRYSAQGNSPLSDIKGLSSFFDKQVHGVILNTDRTIQEIGNGPIGVHGIPDYRHNRIIFTFLNNKSIKPLQNDTNVTISYNVGDLIYDNGLYYEVNTFFTAASGSRLTPSDPRLTPLASDYIPGFTIAYNELTDAFESFYGYKPSLYYNYGRRLLSVDPYNKDRVYEHHRGTKCSFYGRTPEDSTITLLLAPNADITKIFNNIEYQSEVTLNDADVFNESLSSYRMYNEYQDTGTITFTVNSNLKRRMREWRFAVDRDNTDNQSRIRNPYVFLHLTYDNNSDKTFILHDIIVSFTPAPH